MTALNDLTLYSALALDVEVADKGGQAFSAEPETRSPERETARDTHWEDVRQG